jgi:outer membrane biosynthesis protein TonB
MLSIKTPNDVNEAEVPVDHPDDKDLSPGPPAESQPGLSLKSAGVGEELREGELAAPVVRGSRWVDYDTHELLQTISELEDERRWARLREGIWLAILLHLALLSAVTWIPRYVFKVPQVIDPIDAIKNRKDLQYLDLPPDALRALQPKPKIKAVPEKPPVIDKKTLEAMNRPTSPAPTPQPQPAAPAPVQPTPPPPTPQTQQPQVEAPRPQAVPARPTFSMGSQNPIDQLHQAMKDASRNPGSGGAGNAGVGGLAMHPGAGTGGVEVLSDTQGVDFGPWLRRWHFETQKTWDPLIPDEVNPPLLRRGQVLIHFKVLPDGRIMDGSMMLEGRSGDTALDRAAWGALQGSNYPPLPKDFHGPYLELRALFMYNMQPQ